MKDEKNKKITLGANLSDEAKKRMSDMVKSGFTSTTKPTGQPNKPSNYESPVTGSNNQISSKMSSAIRSLDRSPTQIINEVPAKSTEPSSAQRSEPTQTSSNETQVRQSAPERQDFSKPLFTRNNPLKTAHSIKDMSATFVRTPKPKEEPKKQEAEVAKPEAAKSKTAATNKKPSSNFYNKDASAKKFNNPPKKQYAHSDKKKLSAEENIANEKKRLEKQQQDRMIAKYGVKRIVKDEDDALILGDVNVFADLHHEEDDFHITQDQIDQDHEKIFGKDLTIKSQEFDFISTSSGRKSDKRKRFASYVDVVRDVEISGPITVRDLAELISEKAGDVLKALLKSGVNVSINDNIDPDTAELIAGEMGHNVARVEKKTIQDIINDELLSVNPQTRKIPIVVVMGHVDHGKTSLLDAIRSADIAAGEHGGITQHIGAYMVHTKSGGSVTFLDTPGHAAFGSMRARGANVTDVAVLVVAGDDGIQPQTIEAINYIKSAGVPMVVAINKMDKQDANPAKIKNDLLQYGVFVEEFSGDVIAVEISAKTGAGIDKLLETILLQAEMLDLKFDPNSRAFGDMIESKFDKNRGAAVTIILRHGSIKVGDILISGSNYTKVKTILNDKKERLNTVTTGVPVEIFGFTTPPSSGDSIICMQNEQEARELSEFRANAAKAPQAARKPLDPMSIFEKSTQKEVIFIIKADTFGSLEAICGMVDAIKHEQLKIKIVHKGVGMIGESDLELAKITGANILGFHIGVDQRVRVELERSKIVVKLHDIIYHLIDDLKVILSEHLEPLRLEEFVGKAEVKQIFAVGKADSVAGSVVVNGTIIRGFVAKILRNGTVVHSGVVKMLKRFKDEVKEVKSGYDCGIQLKDQFVIQPGDVIECYEEKFITQTIHIK